MRARALSEMPLGLKCPTAWRLGVCAVAEGQVDTGTASRCILFLQRQWLPKSKMVPLGIDETIDKLKMMEGRNSSIRKAVRIAFDRAMNHLSRVHGEPASDLSDID